MAKKKFTKIVAVIIAALCMTACCTEKTDAHGIQTSVVQTTPPAAQTSMPAAQTAAPGAQTEAPGAQTEVPSAQTEVPSIQTVAPAVTEYEGNGRTQREFTRELCLKCGYIFGLTTTNHEEMLSASLQSFHVNNTELEGIFRKAVTPLADAYFQS